MLFHLLHQLKAVQTDRPSTGGVLQPHRQPQTLRLRTNHLWPLERFTARDHWKPCLDRHFAHHPAIRECLNHLGLWPNKAHSSGAQFLSKTNVSQADRTLDERHRSRHQLQPRGEPHESPHHRQAAERKSPRLRCSSPVRSGLGQWPPFPSQGALDCELSTQQADSAPPPTHARDSSL